MLNHDRTLFSTLESWFILGKSFQNGPTIQVVVVFFFAEHRVMEDHQVEDGWPNNSGEIWLISPQKTH